MGGQDVCVCTADLDTREHDGCARASITEPVLQAGSVPLIIAGPTLSSHGSLKSQNLSMCRRAQLLQLGRLLINAHQWAAQNITDLR